MAAPACTPSASPAAAFMRSNCCTWALPASSGCHNSRCGGCARTSATWLASKAPARWPHSHSGAPGWRAASQVQAASMSACQPPQRASCSRPLLSPQPDRSMVSTAQPAWASARACKATMRRDLFISSPQACTNTSAARAAWRLSAGAWWVQKQAPASRGRKKGSTEQGLMGVPGGALAAAGRPQSALQGARPSAASAVRRRAWRSRNQPVRPPWQRFRRRCRRRPR